MRIRFPVLFLHGKQNILELLRIRPKNGKAQEFFCFCRKADQQ